MNRTRVLAWSLLMTSTAALAQGQFSEAVEQSGFNQVPYYYGTAPHAGPVRLNYSADPTVQSPNPATGIVEFASAPAPYVYVNVKAPGIGAGLRATLLYSFDVSGPASSHVPLTFTANFNLSSGNFLSNASVDFNVAGYALDFSAFEGTSASVSCRDSTPSASCAGTTQSQALSSASVSIAGSSTFGIGGSSANGTITGTFMAPTDGAGRGIGVVQMRATAGAGLSESWAFIDPRFEIDSTYLALNPTATFELLPGMGNDLAMMPVPEPTSAVLLSGGILGLWVASRRRKVRSQLE